MAKTLPRGWARSPAAFPPRGARGTARVGKGRGSLPKAALGKSRRLEGRAAPGKGSDRVGISQPPFPHSRRVKAEERGSAEQSGASKLSAPRRGGLWKPSCPREIPLQHQLPSKKPLPHPLSPTCPKPPCASPSQRGLVASATETGGTGTVPSLSLYHEPPKLPGKANAPVAPSGPAEGTPPRPPAPQMLLSEG